MNSIFPLPDFFERMTRRGCLPFILLLLAGDPLNAQSACVDSSLIHFEIACPAIYDPVCGCNGVTYGNSCEAINYGGITSWTPGECVACPDQCPYDITYTLDGTSFHAGLTPPIDTPPFFFFVVWSLDDDNVTGNGLDFVHQFQDTGRHVLCATYPTGDFAPVNCTVCKAFEVTVACIDTAKIDSVPCPLAFIPVCGCDGVTYNNACEAENWAGLTSWRPGVCGSVCNNLFIDFEGFNSGNSLTYWTFNDLSVFANGGSITSWYWDFGNGMTSFEQNPSLNFMDPGDYTVCLTVSGTADDGTQCGANICQIVHVDEQLCINPAQIDSSVLCPTVFDPVCGCNGVTYPNSCVAENYHGITSWKSGICPADCFNPAWVDTLTPCIEIYNPVCGCDETTYQNECFALTHGVTSWTKGECCPSAACKAYFSMKILPDRTVLLSDSSFSAETWFLDFGDGTSHSGFFDSLAHTYAAPGIYQICLSISNFAGTCTSQYCVLADFSSAASQEPGSRIDVRILPNPARNRTLARLDGATARSAALTDLPGKTLLQMQVFASEFELPLDGFPAGAYFLTLETDKGRVVRKLVVER